MRHEEETHRATPGNESAGNESGEALLTLHGVHKRYGEVVALHGIDLTLHRGEVVVILGPSGCGKSTLLRTINGLEPGWRDQHGGCGRLRARRVVGSGAPEGGHGFPEL